MASVNMAIVVGFVGDDPRINQTQSGRKVASFSLAPFGEIFFDEKQSSDRYYKAKLAFITIDEKSGNEKRQNVTYLVHAENFNAAVKNIDEVMGGTMIDYEIISIAETQIMDVFEYHPKETEKADEA